MMMLLKSFLMMINEELMSREGEVWFTVCLWDICVESFAYVGVSLVICVLDTRCVYGDARATLVSSCYMSMNFTCGKYGILLCYVDQTSNVGGSVVLFSDSCVTYGCILLSLLSKFLK